MLLPAKTAMLRAKRPATVETDPYFASVVLLVPGQGANNGTTFTDLKGHPLTRTGSVVTSTAQSKFGGSSIYVPGNGHYLGASSSAEWGPFGGGAGKAYTAEAWVYAISHTDDSYVVGPAGSGNGSGAWGLMSSCSGGGGHKPAIQYWDANYYCIGGSAIPTGEWVHLACSTDGTTSRLFVNGTLAASGLDIGCTGPGSLWIGQQQFYGYLEQIRLTKGVCRYTAGFTPPTAAFPTS